MTKHIPVFSTPTFKLNKQAERLFGKYVPRVRQEGETPPPSESIWDRPAYVPPASTYHREGSQAALAIKSKGLST